MRKGKDKASSIITRVVAINLLLMILSGIILSILYKDAGSGAAGMLIGSLVQFLLNLIAGVIVIILQRTPIQLAQGFFLSAGVVLLIGLFLCFGAFS